MATDAIDLVSFDRDVRRAAGRLEQLRQWLALGSADGRERARSFDVFDGVRHTATMSSYRALKELEPSLLDVPLRDGLLRWVHELLQARVGLDLTIADAEASHAIDARLPPARIAEARRNAVAREAAVAAGTHVPDGDAVAFTYSDAVA